MGNKEIYILKRDGKRVPFSIRKIENAIAKAFLSVGAFAAEEDFRRDDGRGDPESGRNSLDG